MTKLDALERLTSHLKVTPFRLRFMADRIADTLEDDRVKSTTAQTIRDWADEMEADMGRLGIVSLKQQLGS